MLLLLVLELLLGAGGAGAAGGGDVRLLVGVLGDVVLVDRVVEGGVVVGVEVHEVRDGEADGDFFAVQVTDELDNLLAGSVDELKRAVVEEVLDAGGHLLAGLHVLLDLNLAVQLGRELLVRLRGGPAAGRRGEGGARGRQGGGGGGLADAGGDGDGAGDQGLAHRGCRHAGDGAGRLAGECASGQHLVCFLGGNRLRLFYVL